MCRYQINLRQVHLEIDRQMRGDRLRCCSVDNPLAERRKRSPHSIAGDGPAGPFRASENLAPLVVGEIERTDGSKANQHQNSTYYDINNQELTSFSVEDSLGASQPTEAVPIPPSCSSFQ